MTVRDAGQFDPFEGDDLMADLRRFTSGKGRYPREVLLRKIPENHGNPEVHGHWLTLKGRYAESAQAFLALLADGRGERALLIRQAAGAIKKAGPAGRALGREVLALAPALADVPEYMDLVAQASGLAGINQLDAAGLLPPEARAAARRRRLSAAARTLRTGDPLASTRKYIEAVRASGLIASSAEDDLPVLLEASLALGSRIVALRESGRPELAEAASALKKEIAAAGILTPSDLVDRAFAPATRGAKAALAWHLTKTRTIFTTVYDGDEHVKGTIVESLVGDTERSSDNLRAFKALSSLTSAARTVRFWSEPPYRAAICDRLLAATQGLDNATVPLLEARIAFALGNLARFESAIARANACAELTVDRPHHTYIAVDAQIGGQPLRPPPIREVVPRSDRASRAIAVACADINYFRKWVRPFASTHAKVSQGTMPHVHVMAEAAHESEIRAVAAELPGLSVSIEAPAIRAPYYYATNRFLQLENLGTIIGRPIVMVDIDVGFQADVNEPLEMLGTLPDAMFRTNDRVRIFDHAQTYQLAYDFPRLDPWSLVPAGYLYCSQSAAGRRIARVVAEQAGIFLAHFSASGRSNWWIDQNLLFRALVQIRRELPDADVRNIADFGLPYHWRRPEGESLRETRGPHPICARYFDPAGPAGQPAPARPALLDRARSWWKGMRG